MPSRPKVLREFLRVGWGGGGVGMMMFFACAHMRHATQLLRDSCIHVTCYAVWLLRTCDMLRNCWGGWGGGDCWRSLHVHTCDMLRNCWCDMPVDMLRNCCVTLANMWHAGWHATQLLCDSCTHVTCYATVAWLLHTCDMPLRDSCTHVTCRLTCYATVVWLLHTCDMPVDMLRSVTLAHMWHATQLLCDSCTHVTCYATVAWLLHTCDMPVDMLRNCCVTLAHMWHATQLLRDSCTHVTCRLTCYATVVWLLHTCDMLHECFQKPLWKA